MISSEIKHNDADWLAWEFLSMENNSVDVFETVYKQTIVVDNITGRELVFTESIEERPIRNGFDASSMDRNVEYFCLYFND